MAIKQEQYFVLQDGKVLKSLADLSSALDNMPKATFQHHVTAKRNDFANWINGVFKDQPLAAKVAAAKNPQQLHNLIQQSMLPKVKKKIIKPFGETEVKKADIQEHAKKVKGLISKFVPKVKISERVPYAAKIPGGAMEFLFGILIGVLATLILTGNI